MTPATTRTIREADICRVQAWMGHADIQTTMKYPHYESRKEDAELARRERWSCVSSRGGARA